MTAPKTKTAGEKAVRTTRQTALCKPYLGLSEGDYRAMLKRITGKLSGAETTERELAKVLDELRAKGFHASATTARDGRESSFILGRAFRKPERSEEVKLHLATDRPERRRLLLSQPTDQLLPCGVKKQVRCEWC